MPQDKNIQTDVIIVGAGPTGLSLAVQLIRYGIDFIIFDKKEGVTDLSKAMVVHARSLEIYEQVGLAKKAVADGEIVQKGMLMHEGDFTGTIDFSDFGGQLSPFPFMLVFEQSKNERLLYRYLQDNGKQVRWQTELDNLTQDSHRVRVVLKKADGTTQTVEAPYLVGCDGASSPTRHFLQLPFEGSTHPRLFYVADVDMEFETKKATFYATLGRDSFVLMAPMRGERQWRLIGNMPEYDDRSDPDEVTFDRIEAKVRQLVQRPLNIMDVHWFSSYKVHTRHAEPFSKGRCFLAGDAAHVHTPAGGQGMNTGIQDAYDLAWKLAFVLRGRAKASLLDTYDEERVANAKRLLQSTDRFFNVAASDVWYFQILRDAIIPKLANVVTGFEATREFVFKLVSEIGINYRDSSLSFHQNDRQFAVKAGDRMPYFLVNGTSVYDSLQMPKFHLLVFSDGEHSYENLKTELAKDYEDWIDFYVIPLYPKVIKIFAHDKPFLVLLRPDNYIAFISSNCSLKDLNSYFQTVIEQ